MSQPTAQRPPQVTMAAGVVIFSSVLVLLTAGESVSRIRSLGTREAVQETLAQSPYSGLGLSTDGVLDIYYVVGVVAALCAVATGILGWYVTKPDLAARRALTIVAVPLFVTGLLAGGFAASFVAAGTALLWMQPAREWFATGKWTPPTPPAPAPTDSPARPPVHEPATRQDSPDVSSAALAPPLHPPTFGSQPLPPDLPIHIRPPAVITAFVLTVVMAGGALLMALTALAYVALSPELFLSKMEQQQPEAVQEWLTVARLQTMSYALAAALIVWAGAALVFAGFMMARRSWARVALMVTAAFSASACVLLAFSGPVMLFPAMAALATAWSLGRHEVRRWFAAEPR